MTMADAETLIRAARARSNAAIAAHDLAGIVAEWSPDITIVSAAGRASTGRDACGEFLAQQFEKRPDTCYVRSPGRVEIFAAWDVAAEYGEWLGTWTEPDGALRLGGTYQAQWRLFEGRWLIHGELFVPTHCVGSAYCLRHP